MAKKASRTRTCVRGHKVKGEFGFRVDATTKVVIGEKPVQVPEAYALAYAAAGFLEIVKDQPASPKVSIPKKP